MIQCRRKPAGFVHPVTITAVRAILALTMLCLPSCTRPPAPQEAVGSNAKEAKLTVDGAKAALLRYLESDVPGSIPAPGSEDIEKVLTAKQTIDALKNTKGFHEGPNYYFGGGWSCNLETHTFGTMVLWNGSGYSIHGELQYEGNGQWKARIVGVSFVDGPGAGGAGGAGD